jgi:uncharacterized protein YgiM (DUF1202 family)
MKYRKIVAILFLAPIFLFLQSCFLDSVLTINPSSDITPVSTVSDTEKTIVSPEIIVTQPIKTIVSPESETVKCVVKTGLNTGNLNLRTGAGIQYGVLTVLKEGDELEYSGQEENGWKKVKLSDDYTGWVNSNFVDCEN